MTTNIVGKKISQKIPEKIDYLMICASFEDRCLSMYENLDQKNVSKTGIFYFKQFLDNSITNRNKLRDKFNGELFELDYPNPTSTADSLINFFEDLEVNEYKHNIVIDISTFTRESLLIILGYLFINADRFSEIFIFYRFATVSKYLSDGVASIRSVLGYIGDISIDKPTHLILLSGFEYERAKEIIDALEPDFISIGHGGQDCSITPELQILNKEFTNKLLAYYSDEKICAFEHSLKDPVSVKKKILEMAAHLKSEYNTVLVPLNNKVSTIGVALAANEDTTIQLIYAQVNEYNVSSYSRSEDDCLIFELKELMV